MKKTNVILLSMILILSTLSAMPVLAKNLNTEPAKVLYYDGGEATIALPVPLTGYPPSTYPSQAGKTAPYMKILFSHVEIPNRAVKTDSYGMLVQFWQTSSAQQYLHWEPQAFITTDATTVPFLEDFWGGSFIEFPGTYYNNLYKITSFKDTYNIFVVTKEQFNVQRHGNNVFLNLNKDITMTRPNGVTFILPKFSLELNGNGDSTVIKETKIMIEPTHSTIPNAAVYYNAPNIELKIHNRGFIANGLITCSNWNYAGTSTPISDAMVIMQGIQTTTQI